jgi:alkaline phosphatase
LIPVKSDHPDIAKTAKNIILLVGDGMGLTQISSAFYFKKTTPNYARFENIGLTRTSSTVRITDSAAGATAFAAGEKTYNGAIGVDADTMAIPSIVEILSREQWATGLISTSSITHATPACFYAHVKSRGMEQEIAAQMPSSDIDFFAGGGTGFFTDSLRDDKKNVLGELEANGFEVNTKRLERRHDPTKKYAYLLGDPALPAMTQGRGDFLSKATEEALDYLSSSSENFFLMVEGSMIDWGGHANDTEYLVTEMIDFDDAIGVALDYAEKEGNTLVIVTADHETGGFTLSNGVNYDEIKGTFSTGGHSTALIPVAAYGPGSELFRGVYENTGIFHKMMTALSNQESN